jgi:DNA-binding response OmpR family regulator
VTPTQRILIIEDDRAVASSLSDGLKQAGYALRWEKTGEAGIAAARSYHPHLIILDVQLPDGTGFDVCRQMRQLKLHPPILMLTVRKEMVDKVLGLEMGADDYVTKPFEWPELLSRIRALLRRAYGEFTGVSGDLFHAGDLVINLTQGTVERDDKPVNLSPTEFRLLAYLARHAGQAFSRSHLLEAVWGYSATLENEHMVNVYIRRLREKVERDPGRPALILTVPGIGYRLAR